MLAKCAAGKRCQPIDGKLGLLEFLSLQQARDPAMRTGATLTQAENVASELLPKLLSIQAAAVIRGSADASTVRCRAHITTSTATATPHVS